MPRKGLVLPLSLLLMVRVGGGCWVWMEDDRSEWELVEEGEGLSVYVVWCVCCAGHVYEGGGFCVWIKRE